MTRHAAVPLSYQQAMYWDAEQRHQIGYRVIAEDRHVANAFGGLRITGAFDLAVWRRSLNEVLRRQEALRTRFATVDGRMLQIVTETTEVPLACTDVRHLAGVDREAAAASAAAGAALAGFDYGAGLLLRAHLIQVSDDEVIVVLVAPHLVADAASIQILINETLTLYAHFLHGRASPLPEPVMQYADYVRWQQDWVHSPALREVDDYVDRHLAGARPVALPVRHYGLTASPQGDAAELKFVLDDEARRGVYATSLRQRVTPFVVMVSAFTMLLSRWTGRTDILVLAPFAARPDAGTLKLIGMFANLCPLRVNLSGNPRSTDVLEQVQEAVLRTLRHRCVPYAVLADLLRGRGDLSCHGVGVNAVPDGGEVMPRGCRELFGTTTQVTPYVIDTGRLAARQMRGPLSFWIGFAPRGGISGRLMYPRASFDEDTIAQTARHFLSVLDTVTQQPARRLSDLADGPAATWSHAV